MGILELLENLRNRREKRLLRWVGFESVKSKEKQMETFPSWPTLKGISEHCIMLHIVRDLEGIFVFKKKKNTTALHGLQGEPHRPASERHLIPVPELFNYNFRSGAV